LTCSEGPTGNSGPELVLRAGRLPEQDGTVAISPKEKGMSSPLLVNATRLALDKDSAIKRKSSQLELASQAAAPLVGGTEGNVARVSAVVAGERQVYDSDSVGEGHYPRKDLRNDRDVTYGEYARVGSVNTGVIEGQKLNVGPDCAPNVVRLKDVCLVGMDAAMDPAASVAPQGEQRWTCHTMQGKTASNSSELGVPADTKGGASRLCPDVNTPSTVDQSVTTSGVAHDASVVGRTDAAGTLERSPDGKGTGGIAASAILQDAGGGDPKGHGKKGVDGDKSSEGVIFKAFPSAPGRSVREGCEDGWGGGGGARSSITHQSHVDSQAPALPASQEAASHRIRNVEDKGMLLPGADGSPSRHGAESVPPPMYHSGGGGSGVEARGSLALRESSERSPISRGENGVGVAGRRGVGEPKSVKRLNVGEISHMMQKYVSSILDDAKEQREAALLVDDGVRRFKLAGLVLLNERNTPEQLARRVLGLGEGLGQADEDGIFISVVSFIEEARDGQLDVLDLLESP
jgi:hypothetical protein